MQPKPILIGFASAILILVMAAASFFAGLSLGQRGYVADLQYQPPQGGPGNLPPAGLPNGQPSQGNPPQPGPSAGQPNPGGINPQGGPPGAPSWPPDLLGRFVSMTADSITLEGPQRQFTIPINTSTRFTDELGNPLDPAALQAGDTIAVFGRDAATLIMCLPPRPNAP